MPGPAGPSVDGTDLLDIVETQIDELHQNLDAQMKRIADIQQQMDELRAAVRRALFGIDRNRRRHEDRRKVSLGSPTGTESRCQSDRRTSPARRSN